MDLNRKMNTVLVVVGVLLFVAGCCATLGPEEEDWLLATALMPLGFAVAFVPWAFRVLSK